MGTGSPYNSSTIPDIIKNNNMLGGNGIYDQLLRMPNDGVSGGFGSQASRLGIPPKSSVNYYDRDSEFEYQASGMPNAGASSGMPAGMDMARGQGRDPTSAELAGMQSDYFARKARGEPVFSEAPGMDGRLAGRGSSYNTTTAEDMMGGRRGPAIPFGQAMSQLGMGMATGGMTGYAVGGGLGALGSYSDGGRLLKGPGDGVSDSIPATIGAKQQPARLADGEFVVPARIVSELGNGSTEAGAKKLYAMMDRVQRARGKTTGKNKVAANSRADKYLPA
jgi:hypothetical protein